ncbi:hypothetical protein B0T09DRAFT_140277 [Sordaria sp. MPI-SDFR-AT-0083]|nr:hypothetical protein B0T09DRAFT_140277 [Sordaria sp. MPI-SDFR-AT-0083]
MVHNSLMGGACATFFVLSMGFYNGAGERHLQYTGFDFDISGLLLLHGNTQQRERGLEALGNDRTWITARAFLLSFRNRAIKIWEGITMTASQPHGQEEEREDDEHTTRQRDTGRERIMWESNLFGIGVVNFCCSWRVHSWKDCMLLAGDSLTSVWVWAGLGRKRFCDWNMAGAGWMVLPFPFSLVSSFCSFPFPFLLCLHFVLV